MNCQAWLSRSAPGSQTGRKPLVLHSLLCAGTETPTQGSVAQCQTLPQRAFENKCEFQGQCCAQAGAALKGRVLELLPDLGVGLLPESRGREHKCCRLLSSQANPALYWHWGPPCNDKRPCWPLTAPPKSHLPSPGFLQQENNLEWDEITDAKCPVQHLDHGKHSTNKCVRDRRQGELTWWQAVFGIIILHSCRPPWLHGVSHSIQTNRN